MQDYSCNKWEMSHSFPCGTELSIVPTVALVMHAKDRILVSCQRNVHRMHLTIATDS